MRCNENASWQLNETYTRVKGKWFYLHRAINLFLVETQGFNPLYLT
ncbi:DDE-type integrase/transposase/recombinase [Vibrio aestuarianus]